MNSTKFMIHQETDRYRSDLRAWVLNVQHARTFEEALRLATRKPTPGHFLASVRSIVSADTRNAELKIEECLLARTAVLERDAPDTGHVARLKRYAQGHFPRVWHALDRIGR